SLAVMENNPQTSDVWSKAAGIMPQGAHRHPSADRFGETGYCRGYRHRPRRDPMQRARANEMTLMTAPTLWENRPVCAAPRSLWFRARASHGSEIEPELELELDPPSA